MKPSTFRIKPFDVEAMQWVGNFEESGAAITAWLDLLGVAYTPSSDAAGWPTIQLTESGTVLRTGGWVVRRPDGYTFALAGDRFTESYEPA